MVSSFAAFIDPGGTFDEEEAFEGAPMGFEPVEDLSQACDGAKHEGVASPCLQDLLNVHGVDGDVELQLVDDIGYGAGLLTDGIAERDVQVGADDGEDDAGDTSAGADIEDLFAFAKVACNNETVDDVTADEAVVVGVPCEVDLGVPLPERLGVAVEEGDLVVRQFDLVSGQCVGKGIGVFGHASVFLERGRSRLHRSCATASMKHTRGGMDRRNDLMEATQTTPLACLRDVPPSETRRSAPSAGALQ